jgi:hypothetical protein
MDKSKLTELVTQRERLAITQKKLKRDVKLIFKDVEESEKGGWRNLDRDTIRLNNEKRQTGWDKMTEIKKIDNELIELDSRIKSLKIQQKWEFVVCDSKLRGHIQMVINDISRLNNSLEYTVIDQELKDTLMDLKKIVTSIQDA